MYVYLQLVFSGFTFGSLYRCWQIWQARMFLSICLMTCESHDWLPVPESSSSCCCWWWWWRDVDDERGEEAVPWPELHPAYRDEMVPEPGDRRRGFCCNKISDSFEEEIGFWKLFQFFLFSFLNGRNPTSILFIFVLSSQHNDIMVQNLTIKSIDGLLGTRTQGGRMLGADESTELWRHPVLFSLIFWFIQSFFRKNIFSVQTKFWFKILLKLWSSSSYSQDRLHSIITLYENKAFWLDVPNYTTSFN